MVSNGVLLKGYYITFLSFLKFCPGKRELTTQREDTKAKKAGRFYELESLIEDHYEIKINQLPNAKFIMRIRDGVNIFKHNKGIKDIRKIKSDKLIFPRYYKPKTRTAYELIKKVNVFIRALWKATNRI